MCVLRLYSLDCASRNLQCHRHKHREYSRQQEYILTMAHYLRYYRQKLALIMYHNSWNMRLITEPSLSFLPSKQCGQLLDVALEEAWANEGGVTDTCASQIYIRVAWSGAPGLRTYSRAFVCTWLTHVFGYPSIPAFAPTPASRSLESSHTALVRCDINYYGGQKVAHVASSLSTDRIA